jgi:hypothetical protein
MGNAKVKLFHMTHLRVAVTSLMVLAVHTVPVTTQEAVTSPMALAVHTVPVTTQEAVISPMALVV